jgi:excisionase family DNA binding protein
MLAELLGRKFPSVEDKLDRLRDLLASRRKEHLVVEEFAELVGRTPYTVRRWIAEGKVQAIRIRGGGPRGKLLIARAELERIIGSGLGGGVPDCSV